MQRAFKSICYECGNTNTTKVKGNKHIMFHIMQKKKIRCEQCGNAFRQKLILHQNTTTVFMAKPYTYKYTYTCELKDSVFRKSYIDFFMLSYVIYCLTHNILQDVTATRDFKPCKC